MTELVPGDLLTIAQVLQLVPIGRSTIYTLIGSSKLPHYRVRALGPRRGRILIHRADLKAFIEKSRVGGAS